MLSRLEQGQRAWLIDIESRSRLNIKKTNTWKYWRHTSTVALCATIWDESGSHMLWVPGDPPPSYESGDKIVAYNGEFEYVGINECLAKHHGWPPATPEQIDCLHARACYVGLPRNLGKVLDALGFGDRGKDVKGKANMLRLCRPQRIEKDTTTGEPFYVVLPMTGSTRPGCELLGGKFDDKLEKHARNYEYCVHDGRIEFTLARFAPPLRPAQATYWHIHHQINECGVPVDLHYARNCTTLARWEYDRLSEKIHDVTAGAVAGTNDINKMKDWLVTRGVPLERNEQTNNLLMDAGVVDDLVSREQLLAEDAAEVLRIRQLSQASPVKKFPNILNYTEADGRSRGAAVFCGAGPGRSAGRGINWLNLTRLNEDRYDDDLELAERISSAGTMGPELHKIWGEMVSDGKADESEGVISRLSRMVRFAVCAREGHKLVDCDLKAIEQRVMHWMAGDELGLQQIRDFDGGVGHEPYVLMASKIYKIPPEQVTRQQRKVGKVPILAGQYLQGGYGLKEYGRKIGIDLPLDEWKRIVQIYRQNNPLVKRMWYAYEDAALDAVRSGRSASVGPVTFRRTPNTLRIRLPSGRELFYRDPAVEQGKYGPEIECTDIGEQDRKGSVGKGRRRISLPVIVENVCQGIAYCVLSESIVRGVERYNLPVVLHVYDSIMCEAADNRAKTVFDRMKEVMTEPPPWAPDLPLAVSGDITQRMT